jgi:hypothetical protein
MRRKEFEKAEQALEKAIEKNPDSIEYKKSKALLLINRGRLNFYIDVKRL